MAKEKTDERTPTDCEIRVLVFAANGYSYEETGDITFNSKRTIEKHAYKVMQRLGAYNITHAVVLAHRKGFMSLDA